MGALPPLVATHDLNAAALQSDIGAERFEVVEGGKLRRYWIGTVYGGGVATERGYKFATPEFTAA